MYSSAQYRSEPEPEASEDDDCRCCAVTPAQRKSACVRRVSGSRDPQQLNIVAMLARRAYREDLPQLRKQSGGSLSNM
jgi:hypothetical protein